MNPCPTHKPAVGQKGPLVQRGLPRSGWGIVKKRTTHGAPHQTKTISTEKGGDGFLLFASGFYVGIGSNVTVNDTVGCFKSADVLSD